MEMDAEIIDYPTNGGRRGPSLPHAVDAERALLGAFMVNNEVLDNVSAFLKKSSFTIKGTSSLSARCCAYLKTAHLTRYCSPSV